MLQEYKDSGKFTQNTTEAVKQLERILASKNLHPRLVGSDGEEILLPEPVYDALCQVVRAMASGQKVTIVPSDREMTTQEAADFLNVSRPYLIKLLEQGEIPYTKVGSHRRICSQDVLTYKQQRDAKRRQKLSEITAFLQEEGFYDEDSFNDDE